MKKRIFHDLTFFPDKLNEESTDWFLEKLSEIKQTDKIPRVMVQTAGGITTCGLFIYSYIKLYCPDIVIIASTDISSAGIPLLLAAKRENRFITPYTRMLLHETYAKTKKYGNVSVSHSKFKTLRRIVRKDMLLDENMYTDLMVTETNLTWKQVKKMNRRETYLQGHQIVKYGFASKIITWLSEIQ